MRLNLCHHDFTKNIRPAVVCNDSDPLLACASRQSIPVWFRRAESGENINGGVTLESFGDGQYFGFGERIGDTAAKAQIPASCSGNSLGKKPHAVLDQSLIGLAC